MTESRDSDILLRKKVEELEQKCLRYEQVIMGIVERFVRVEEAVVECEKCIDYEKDNIRLGHRLGDLLDLHVKNKEESERVIRRAKEMVEVIYSLKQSDTEFVRRELALSQAITDYYDREE